MRDGRPISVPAPGPRKDIQRWCSSAGIAVQNCRRRGVAPVSDASGAGGWWTRRAQQPRTALILPWEVKEEGATPRACAGGARIERARRGQVAAACGNIVGCEMDGAGVDRASGAHRQTSWGKYPDEQIN